MRGEARISNSTAHLASGTHEFSHIISIPNKLPMEMVSIFKICMFIFYNEKIIYSSK